MRKNVCVAKITIIISLWFCSVVVRAQSIDLPKYELGVEFTSFSREEFSRGRSEPGIGARFTYNLNESIAFESAGYIFPNICHSCSRNGRLTEGFFGVKAGKRFEKWGLFAKARPGVVSFSRGHLDIIPLSPTSNPPFRSEFNRANHFAFDLGAVLEFYPSKRIVTRFDAGDTVVHHGRRTINVFAFDPADPFGISLVPFTIPARTRHNFQFSAGVGFRF